MGIVGGSTVRGYRSKGTGSRWSVLSTRVTGPRAGAASGRGHRAGAGLPRGSRALPRPGKHPILLLFPILCASRGAPSPRLRPPGRRVYSSPSRRTPVSAAARTPRTGYCGRRRRSDRPFRTGFIRWLEEELVLPQAPVFHEFLESIIFFNFKVLFWTESSILAQDERWRRA